MTTHTDRLLKNVSLWAPDCPKQSTLLLELVPERITPCETDQGEPNIKASIGGVETTYHSSKDAEKEAKEWFDTQNLYQSKALIVYGVGAGHYFKAALNWLSEDRKRVLVFLEDDLEVIFHLFNSKIGKELLTHSQVHLYFLEKDEKGNFLESSFESIPSVLFLHQPVFSFLAIYGELKKDLVENCSKLIGYFRNYNTYQLFEQLTYGKQFFKNFYRNLLELSDSDFADSMFKKFQGIPAVVCGAGPSLDKNRELLESLGDHALVIAGGSAMNTVNLNGWLPHFGIAVDPNLSQYSRMFMNQSFDVPYFYRNRVFPEALRLLHGEHLYVSGSGGYDIANWFENQLGIEGCELEQGMNVVNFGIALAEALGCSPIILVGVDMAYTEGQSYASGILPHPILDLGQGPKTRSMTEQVVEKSDIYGNPIHTLWKWIQESVWISQFSISKPEAQLINATEGGIGVEKVPNQTLASVKEQFLKTPFDIDALIHIRIQESSFGNAFNAEQIVDKMLVLMKSLKACKGHCLTLIKEFYSVLETVEQSDEENHKLMTDDALAALKQLNQEDAFKAILSKFNESFLSFYGREGIESLYKEQDKRLDQKEINCRRTKLNIKRYKFLKGVCNENIERISTTLKESQIRKLITEGLLEQNEQGVEKGEDVLKAKKHLEELLYEITDSTFKVEDSDLGVTFEGHLVQEPIIEIPIEIMQENEGKAHEIPADYTGKVHCVSSEKKIVSEQYFQNGSLHGPSRGYFSDGSLACQTFYHEGKKHGKSLFFYPDGKLYSIKSYRNGIKQGQQITFHENGNKKMSSHYLDGQLDGMVSQYFTSKVLKRKLQYIRGKRHGKEIIWNLGGIKEIEINYIQDVPVGFSRSWHLNGQLAREVFYDENGKMVYVNGWTPDGVELPIELLIREDYFDKVSRQAGKLAGSIEEIIGHVNQIVPELNRSENIQDNETISTDIQELVSEMDHLREVYQQIESFKEKTSEGAKEALWKTPETQKILGNQLSQIAENMAEDIGNIEHTLKLMDQLLKHPKDEDQESK